MSICYSEENKDCKIRYTVHKCPDTMKKNIQLVFQNDIDLKNENILIIPTWQKASLSLLDINQEVTEEMDRLFLNFKKWSLNLKNKINKKNKWMNASSPFTGKALFGTPSGHTYSELEGLTKLLKYNSDQVGCCGMVYHPEFKDRSYPITLFTNLELEELKQILNN